jgi:hypothetical protein
MFWNATFGVNSGGAKSIIQLPSGNYVLAGGMLNSDTDFSLFETQSDGSMPATTKFTITPSAGTSVIIGPNTNQTFILGSKITFTITPNNNYQISNVIVDGNDVEAVSTYTFPDVQANHNITANFSPIVWSITTSAGNGGSINPSSTQTINKL